MRNKKINFGNVFFENDNMYSDLYRRFSACFNCLLEPEINDEEYIKNCYVQSDAEDYLYDCINNLTDGIYHLIGYTGIGKTTLLCHLFSTHPNCTNPIIDDKKLYLPTFFDSQIIDSKEEIINSVARKFASYCRYIKETFSPVILSSMEQYKELFNLSLYEVIKNNKSNLLEYGIVEESDFLNDSYEQQIDFLKKYNIFAYYLCMFKLLLNQPDVLVNSVVLVLDDIESLNENYETEIMDVYYRAYECIKNNVNREYKVKLVVSGRPHTFRYIRSQKSLKRKFESYGVSHEIRITTPPELRLIFQKRFKYYKDKLLADGNLQIMNSSSWDNAYNCLKRILREADLNVGSIIYQLNFYNIRESMLSFVKLLCNRTWMQKNIPMEASFVISLENFNLSPSVLLKAIILGNNDFYANNQLVPNIFLSNKYENFSYYCLIIMQHFILNNSSNDYGMLNYDISTFFKVCIELWDDDICDIMERCINYLIDNKLLLYSVHEYEYENKEISKSDKRKLYLSSKGVCIWNLLCTNSILLECYREDTYRNYSESIYYKLNKFLSQEQILIDLLKFIEEIAIVERNNIGVFINSNKIDNYQQMFGEELVSYHLLIGVENTIRYFFNAYNRDLSDEFKNSYIQLKNFILDTSNL